MQSRPNDRVAVWLDCGDPLVNEPDVMYALTCITGDSLKAYYLISGRDETSSYPGKGVVALVTEDVAEVIVRWLKSVGAPAFIDHGYFEDVHGA